MKVKGFDYDRLNELGDDARWGLLRKERKHRRRMRREMKARFK